MRGLPTLFQFRSHLRGLTRAGHTVFFSSHTLSEVEALDGAGVTGEQFALPEAVVSLRAVRRDDKPGPLLAVSAADPLNLAGILTPGERIPALSRNRIVFQDGVPLALLEAGEVRFLGGLEAGGVLLLAWSVFGR